jgi:hypothetical protein
MPLVFSPYIELLWKHLPASLEEIKAAGFDGVECHLIGRLRSADRVQEVRREASRLGLRLRFHQGWSWRTGQRGLINMLLRPLGALVPHGMPLCDQVSAIGPNPVVIYGNLLHEDRDKYRYQTASEHVNGGPYARAFKDFVQKALMDKCLIVFDTQHVLEWDANVLGVEGLPSDQAVLLDRVTALWRLLRSQVVEIHLCDFDPRLGRSHGRNLFLGDGVFPLEAFCQVVKESGWHGIVTPEVKPQHLRGDRLHMECEKVRQLFN